MIKIIVEVGINLIETFMLVDFVTRYLGSKYNGKKKHIGFLVAWFVSFVELCSINYLMHFEHIAGFIQVVIYLVYAMICLNGTLKQKIWIAALSEGMIYIIGISVNMLVCTIIGYDPMDVFTVFNIVRVIIMIMAKVILFYVMKICLRFKYKYPLDKHVWIILIIIPCISIISLSALTLAASYHDDITSYILCGMSGIIAANIITYWFFTVINKEYENKLKLKVLEQEKENSINNEKNNAEFIRQMREVRHSVKNQMIAVLSFIELKKIDEAKKYIRDIIDYRLPILQSFVNTDNEAFNAIINSKIAICNEKNISILINVSECKIQYFDMTDVVDLFGNLLDNAIEASELTRERSIKLEIRQDDEYLFILVENSIKESVLKNNAELNTSKKNKAEHGIGIKSIRRVVDRYNGLIEFFENTNTFCCQILIDKEKLENSAVKLY